MALEQTAAIASMLRSITNFAPDYIPCGGDSFWGKTQAPLVYSPNLFFEYLNDFITPGGSVVATTLHPFGWKYVGDGNGNVTSVDGAGGLLQIACTATANDEQYLSLDGFTTAGNDFFKITANSGKRLWYEARVLASSAASGGFFAGLALHAANAANFLVDTTTELADVDVIGFTIDTDAPTQWIYTHKKTGQTVYESSVVATNDAANFVRLGFYFDGGTQIKIFANDVQFSTVLDPSVATFPTGVALVPIFGLKSPGASARNLQVDYLKVVQGR